MTLLLCPGSEPHVSNTRPYVQGTECSSSVGLIMQKETPKPKNCPDEELLLKINGADSRANNTSEPQTNKWSNQQWTSFICGYTWKPLHKIQPRSKITNHRVSFRTTVTSFTNCQVSESWGSIEFLLLNFHISLVFCATDNIQAWYRKVFKWALLSLDFGVKFLHSID